MIDVGSLGRLVKEADTIVSVCPPDSALEVAREVAEAGFDGLYVDANAIAPTTCERIGELFDRFVDGCIIGLPPHQPGTTRMYLVGDEADSIASHWNDFNLNVVTFEGGVGHVTTGQRADRARRCRPKFSEGVAIRWRNARNCGHF